MQVAGGQLKEKEKEYILETASHLLFSFLGETDLFNSLLVYGIKEFNKVPLTTLFLSFW